MDIAIDIDIDIDKGINIGIYIDTDIGVDIAIYSQSEAAIAGCIPTTHRIATILSRIALIFASHASRRPSSIARSRCSSRTSPQYLRISRGG